MSTVSNKAPTVNFNSGSLLGNLTKTVGAVAVSTGNTIVNAASGFDELIDASTKGATWLNNAAEHMLVKQKEAHFNDLATYKMVSRGETLLTVIDEKAKLNKLKANNSTEYNEALAILGWDENLDEVD